MSKSLFETQFIKYCKLISDTYSINYDELIGLWDNKDKKETKVDSKKEIKVESKKEIKKVEKNDIETENAGCPYTYTKGQKAGQECGVKAKNGGRYCSVHKKYENTEPKEKKNIPITTRTQKAIEESRTKIILPKKRTEYSTFRKNNELDLYINEATNFALKSMQTRLVIGKIIDNKLHPLTDKDKEECLRYNMKYE
jgi:hypothetical protein